MKYVPLGTIEKKLNGSKDKNLYQEYGILVLNPLSLFFIKKY